MSHAMTLAHRTAPAPALKLAHGSRRHGAMRPLKATSSSPSSGAGAQQSSSSSPAAVSSPEAVGVKQRVLITGSTRGLGLALAREFLARGDDVFITSRDADRVASVVAELSRDADGRVAGIAADVRDAESIERMATAAVDAFGGVDLWINNAASNGYAYENLADADPSTLEEIIMTNSLGSLLCTRQAIRTMKVYPGRGHVFNLEGAGSDGSATRKYAAYGHSKAGMAQLAKTMASENKDSGTLVGVHTISPGMVFTELISSGRYAFGSQGRMFVNALAEPAEVAAGIVVDRVKAATADPNAVTKTLAIKLLTPDVAVKKLFRRFVLQENKDRYYPENDDKDSK
jgi:chlorophyll(ide) b reductase